MASACPTRSAWTLSVYVPSTLLNQKLFSGSSDPSTDSYPALGRYFFWGKVHVRLRCTAIFPRGARRVILGNPPRAPCLGGGICRIGSSGEKTFARPQTSVTVPSDAAWSATRLRLDGIMTGWWKVIFQLPFNQAEIAHVKFIILFPISGVALQRYIHIIEWRLLELKIRFGI